MKSIRDIYKIGTGPSSSHTMGPEAAARHFLANHPEADGFRVILYGSLSKTGAGHGTDRAVKAVFSPLPCEVVFARQDPEDMKHPNTMDILALRDGVPVATQRYYSIGGGDIRAEGLDLQQEEE